MLLVDVDESSPETHLYDLPLKTTILRHSGFPTEDRLAVLLDWKQLIVLDRQDHTPGFPGPPSAGKENSPATCGKPVGPRGKASFPSQFNEGSSYGFQPKGTAPREK